MVAPAWCGALALADRALALLADSGSGALVRPGIELCGAPGPARRAAPKDEGIGAFGTRVHGQGRRGDVDDGHRRFLVGEESLGEA